MLTIFKNLIRNKDFLAITIIFFLAFLFFSKGILQNQLIWGYDTPKLIYPLIFLLDESFKHLRLPLWTPDIYFGFPIGADGQIPWFYPFSILHVFLPLNLTVTILSFLHVFAAGIFTYFFARIINLSRFASLFAGIVFMFNGFIIAHMQYFSHIYAYAYLPLILLFIELAILKKDNFYFILAGGSFGLQLLSGHPNIPVMTIIYVILYLFLRSKIKIRNFLGVSTILGIALMISLPYVLYSIRLIPLSIRGQGVDFADATNSSFSLFDLVTFIFPNFFFEKINGSWVSTNTWHFWSYWGQIETTGYVGVFTIFLIPLALFKKVRVKTLPFFVLLFTSLLLAFGKNTPLYSLLFHFPIFNGLRAPGKFLFLVDFSLVILAAFGIDALLQIEQRKKIRINIAIIFGVCLIAIFVIAGSFLTQFYPNQTYDFIRQNYSKLGYVTNLDNTVSIQQMVITSFQEQTKMGLVLATISAIVILFIWNGFKKVFVKFMVILLIVVDLFIFANQVNLWKNFNELINRTDSTINRLEKELTYEVGRVYTLNNSWNELIPDQLIPHRIPEANGFASLPLKRFENWQREAEAQWREGRSDLFKQGSIKYIFDSRLGGLLAVNDYLPRAYVTDRILDVRQGEESLALITSPQTPLGTVVLESDNPQSNLMGQKVVSQPQVLTAQINIYQPDYAKITSEALFNGVLVLTDTYFPDWEAYINGQKTSIYPANYLFRGVKLSSGINIVEFKYKPKFLNISILISLGTIMVILLIFFKKLINRINI